MATGTYDGDGETWPALCRYAEDGEQPNETIVFFPPVEDQAERTAYLKERIPGGKHAHAGSIVTDGLGDFTTGAVTPGMTVSAPNANEIPFAFDSAKANVYSVTTGIVFDAASAVRRVEVWNKTNAGFSIRCFDSGGTQIDPSAFVVAFDFAITEVET